MQSKGQNLSTSPGSLHLISPDTRVVQHHLTVCGCVLCGPPPQHLQRNCSMALSCVQVTPDAWIACSTHALSTEAEEVMGLLLGDIRQAKPGGPLTAHIWMAVPQIRTDRRKDRVETSPAQMAECSALAEQATRETGIRTRVVGWYHSHPHITVLPSHVDVHTQAMYQMLDEGFVGLIFSVFNTDSATQGNHIHVTAFQSVPSTFEPLHEMSSSDLEGFDQQTRSAIRAATAAESHGTSASWVRKEVAMVVAPCHGTSSSGQQRRLADYVAVQNILMHEEQASYAEGLSRPSEKGASGMQPAAALSSLYHAAVYQQSLCQLMELTLAPALQALQYQAVQATVQRKQLQAEAVFLQQEAVRQQQWHRPFAADEVGQLGDVTADLLHLSMDEVNTAASALASLLQAHRAV